MDNIIYIEPILISAKEMPGIICINLRRYYMRCGNFYTRFSRRTLVVLYKDCADIISIKFNHGSPASLIRCITNYTLDNVLEGICVNVGEYNIIIETRDRTDIVDRRCVCFHDNLVNMDIEIPKESIMLAYCCKKMNAVISEINVLRSTFAKYAATELEIPRYIVRITCPSQEYDMYVNKLVHNESITIRSTIDYSCYDAAPGSEKLSWMKYISTKLFSIDKYNTNDNKSKYWNVMKISIPLLQGITVKDIKPIFKSLMRFIKFYVVHNGIVEEDLLKYLKVSDAIITIDSVLVITVVYKGDDKEIE